MTFRLTVNLDPIRVEFEAGSVKEAIGILEAEESELLRIAGIGETLAPAAETATPAANAETAKPARKPRGSKNAPDPATAAAPPPAPVPAPAPASNDPGPLPAFLDRSASPPPPPLPAAPSVVPPAAPPVGVLGGKIAADVKKRKENSPDGGAGITKWLADTGLFVPGATFDEMVACVQFLDDVKLKPYADALQIA